jgi:hypothetical protein
MRRSPNPRGGCFPDSAPGLQLQAILFSRLQTFSTTALVLSIYAPRTVYRFGAGRPPTNKELEITRTATKIA